MPSAPDLSGHVLDDRYELHDLIGEGTFGRVYRGRDRRLRRAVAIKVIKPWWSDDPAWVERFEREAQLLARVNDPGIVQIFDVGHAAEGLYYVAELIDGESLAARLRSGPLTMPESTRIAERLASALAHAHDQRVVHRDIKPANILIAADGRVKVSDFGVARLAEGSSHGAGATAIGTPRYMSPEQARGKPTTAASDVYGVGVVLYEMLAGRPPFAGEAAVDVAVQHLQDPPPPLPGDVPAMLATVVARALEKDPLDRYPDGGALARALTDVAATLPPAGDPVTTILPAVRPAHAEAQTQIARTAVAGAAADAPTSVARTSVAQPAAPVEADAATRVARRRPAPPPPPRRWSRRKRRRVALGTLLGFAALIVISLLVHGSRTTVPELVGLRRGGVTARAQRGHLHARFAKRFSSRPAGTAIDQSPAAGARVGKGSTVRVTLSAGPRPVAVPTVTGQDVAAARDALRARGLLARVTEVSSPGSTTGTVVGQDPRPPATAAPGATVALSVAAAPQWRAVTSFSGRDAGSSVPFRIRGGRWRVVSTMTFNGRCKLFVVCFGPGAEVTSVPTADVVDSWDLDKGTDKVRTFETGPGVYQVNVSRGSDHARWTIQVQDFS